MTCKERILRDTMALREAIRLDVVELANRSWTDDDRREILGCVALCTLYRFQSRMNRGDPQQKGFATAPADRQAILIRKRY
jgi:hypothetical protein